MQPAQQVSFDRYTVDLRTARLWRGKRAIALTSQTFAVLRYLVEHAGQVVSKAELFTALWPNTVVSDGALTFCIVELRKALGDDAKAPRFIETVHRCGYRFIAPLTATAPAEGSTFQVPSAHSPIHNLQSAIPMVGRETELANLHRWLAKALNGERKIVFVTGEAGIGKTTVVEAFLAELRKQGGGSSSPIDSRSAPPDPWLAWGQ